MQELRPRQGPLVANELSSWARSSTDRDRGLSRGNDATYTATITPEAAGTVTVGHRGRPGEGQRR